MRGATNGLHIVKSFGGVGEAGLAQQCQVTTYTTIILGGNVPRFVSDRKMSKTLNFLVSARDAFNRDHEIDLKDSNALCEIMRKPVKEKYSIAEKASINSILELAKLMKPKLKDINSPSHFIAMKSTVIDGDSNHVGFAEVTIDASIEECASTEFMAYSRRNYNEFSQKDGGVLRNIFQYPNHSLVNRSVYDIGIPGFSDREFVWKTIWKKIDDTIVVVYEPISELDAAWNFTETSANVVRAKSWVLATFRKLDDVNGISQTEMTYLAHMNLAGHVPATVMNKSLPGRLIQVNRPRLLFDKGEIIRLFVQNQPTQKSPVLKGVVESNLKEDIILLHQTYKLIT